MRWRRGWTDLYSSVTAEVKIELVGMRDVRIHSSTSGNVSTTSNLEKQNLFQLPSILMLFDFQLVFPLFRHLEKKKADIAGLLMH